MSDATLPVPSGRLEPQLAGRRAGATSAFAGRRSCGPTGPAPKSPRCSTCRSPTCCSARRPSTARTMPRDEVQLSHPAVDQDRRLPRGLRLLRQSASAETGLKADKLMDVDAVLAAARRRPRTPARSASAWARPGATPRTATCPRSSRWSKGVQAMGLETCMTLGMLTPHQAEQLAEAGLDYYNHNIDTSPETLRRRHHDPDLRGPARHAGQCPRGRDQRVLRRHRRHGRDARRPGRLRPRAGDPAAPSRERAGQRAGAGQGHGARRHARRHAAGEDRRHRVRPHRRGRADHHAAEHGAPVGRPREHERGDARRCASWPAPTRSSPATSC